MEVKKGCLRKKKNGTKRAKKNGKKRNGKTDELVKFFVFSLSHIIRLSRRFLLFFGSIFITPQLN
jgi:hypothetical protein